MKTKHIEADICDCCGDPLPGALSRRSLLRGAAGAGFLGLAVPAIPPPASAQIQAFGNPATLPDRHEILIRNGSLLTVDPALGNIEGADIHVRNGEIVAIAQNLPDMPGAEIIDASKMIVMPGMVDTHSHLWTSMMRNMMAADFEYFAVKREVVPHVTAADFYASDMLAMAEALNAGITTVHNFCHHVMSQETVEAEMLAHRDSGMRALYTFGHPDGLDSNQLIDLPLAERIHDEWFGAGEPLEGRVAFGMNTRGLHVLSENIFREEMDWAFARGLTVAMHAGQSRRNYSVIPLQEWGYLGPKTIITHFVRAEPEDRAAMVETGAPLSYSIHSELRLGGTGYQPQQLVHMVNDGITVSLSFDGNALAPIDMFESMSTAWYVGIPFDGTDTEGLAPLNFADVIRMGTINGAVALGLGPVTGSLTVGKRADIVLVRATDLNMLPYGNVESMIARTARAANVDTVIADGRIMKRGGNLVGLDVERIKEDFVRSSYDLRMRAGGNLAVTGSLANLY